jgi:hypothetical protein
MSRMQRAASAWLLAAAATISVAATSGVRSQQPERPASAGMLDEHPAIQYAARPGRDRVSRLDRALAEGTATLAFHQSNGYLRAVLDALGVPAESQILVFSKTGIQRVHTSPQNPRAIFFTDDVVVGYIPGSRHLELAAHDPEQGVVFYTIDQATTSEPRITRRDACLTCHVSASTSEVPGMIARSMFVGSNGDAMPQLGGFFVNHRTPLSQRWGGWFVTGRYVTSPYGGVGHMGNVTTAIHPTSGPATTSNEVFIEWLNSVPETRGYLSAESDIAALLVFDHQMHAINLLTRLNWEARVAASEKGADFRQGALRDLVNELTDYLLFVDEVPPPARVTPRSGFAERFTAAGPHDQQGRSLRQLDLDRRLLRYPCSYMVYTRAFEHLPPGAREAVYRRMWSILSGQDTSTRYAHLSLEDRRAIIGILRDTKHDLPDAFGNANNR